MFIGIFLFIESFFYKRYGKYEMILLFEKE